MSALLSGEAATLPDRLGTMDSRAPRLAAALGRIARAPQLLVVCSYDGALAPFADDPTRAAPAPEGVAALRALAALPQTSVAVVSGRELRELAALSRLPAEVHLIGSHGLELDVVLGDQLPENLAGLRARLHAELLGLTADAPGIRVETRPVGIAVHTGAATAEIAERVAEAIHLGPAGWPDVHVTTGRHLIELAVIPADKGTAVDSLRAQMSASALLFIGDDRTDEDVFARLHGPDVGIRVGGGAETQADHRVETATDALALLAEARRRWLHGERAVAIERHAMLSNQHTMALVTPDATITWLCHPRPDSGAVFADLLGGRPAGHFSITPEPNRLPLGQRYRHATMTVETRWSGLTVTDWLDRPAPGGETVLVRTLSGSGRALVEFAPRPEFGQVPVRLERRDEGLLIRGTDQPGALYAPGVRWSVRNEDGHDTARALVDLGELGGPLTLELRLGTDDLRPPRLEPEHRRLLTEQDSRDWAAALALPTVARQDVLRSALTLRGLCHEPTGAILAAATTSLPEEIGGVRNWDYRYCWLRDAAMTARVLVDLGSTAEAEALLGWIGRRVEATGGHPERLRPLYGIDGIELGPEAAIETLPGYAGSRPVRVGNLADHQLQLDIFGPVTDLVGAVADARGALHEHERLLLEESVRAVARRWHEPDHGLWEARLQPRHHVYSKVMCWFTVERALQTLRYHTGVKRSDWTRLRDRIGADVLTRGWHEEAGAYTAAYGCPDMDASSLWIGLSGLLPDDDPRFLATVLKIESELRSGPVVYRYRWDDGLPGREGGFHLCTTWLIQAYLQTGRRDDAEELFAQLLNTTGPTGLLPEQYDPLTERSLGNHPQAYSHLGLIRCALLLDDTQPSS